MKTYGGVPVPFTVSWSLEDMAWHLDICPYSKRLAIMQRCAPGQGKPRFGAPHSQRQRQAIAKGLCDLCGRSLSGRTKVSLSHAHVRLNGADGPCVMQVEPLLHKGCAAKSMAHCPSLRRDIHEGSLHIRHVGRYRPQFALMEAEYCRTITGDARIAVGHAKVELLSWTDRDVAWLEVGVPA